MLPIYILAGGKSSRFGSDKARADVNGEPLLKRIARVLAPVASRVSVVADCPGKYDDLGLRTLSDVRPGLGPIGGLLTALSDLDAPGWLLLCSCDFVAMNAAWVETLASARAPDIQAIAFKGERIEPLFALYHSSLLHAIERRIDAGELSPSQVIQSVPNALLPLPANWPELAHVNTREELARAHTPNCSR
ncbi:MAG: molybdenum cofactor guanylyltransferase [Planctomycetota bacterium]